MSQGVAGAAKRAKFIKNGTNTKTIKKFIVNFLKEQKRQKSIK